MKVDKHAVGRDDDTPRTALITGGDGMPERGRGMILNAASALSFQSLPFRAVYAGSKACISSLTQAPAAELKPCGVHVARLYPARPTIMTAKVCAGTVSGCVKSSFAPICPRAGTGIRFYHMLKSDCESFRRTLYNVFYFL